MRENACLRQAVCWLLMGGIGFTPALAARADGNSPVSFRSTAPAAAPVQGAAPIGDVALAPGGILMGQVLDERLQPTADVAVSIRVGEETVATTRTDGQGVFAVNGLRGGVHQIATDRSIETCRLWAPATAPPAAADYVQIVAGRDVARGQWGPPPGNGFVQQAKVLATNPFIIGGVFAAAIAIPVALHNADRDKAPSS